MFDQPMLPGIGGSDSLFVPDSLQGRDEPAHHYLLFFALLPPQDTVLMAAQVGGDLRRRHGLSHALMPPERMHMAVQPIVAFEHAIPALIVQAARRAAADAAAHAMALPITFDRAGSIGAQAPTALVLLCDSKSRQVVSMFRRMLAHSLQRHGFSPATRGAPHMTLVYGTEPVAEGAIEPIDWIADRMVLVVSHHGLGHHQLVGQWPLRSRP